MAKYIDLPTKLPRELKNIQNFGVQCPRQEKAKAKRLLVVLDYVPTEDLRTKKLLATATGETYKNMVAHVKNVYDLDKGFDSFDYLIVNFHSVKVAGLSEDLRKSALNTFGKRLDRIIADYEPDFVMCHGLDPFKHLAPDCLEFSKNNHTVWLGQLLDCERKDHKFKLVYNLSLNSILNPKSIKNTAYLLGFASDNYLPIFQGKNPYNIDTVKVGKKRNFTISYVDTIKKFDTLLKEITKAKYVAIDTETDSLNRVVTVLQTIQFSTDGKTAYVIPYHHKDSPFGPKEIKYIREKLQKYFESNQNKYQIYTNAKFDLNVLRRILGVHYFCSDVWDLIAGEFAFDENRKLVKSVTGAGFYNLKNISMYYGSLAYLQCKFGKEQRATIHQVPLSEEVLEYASLDVIIPWRVMFKQMQRAKDIGYSKYKSIVGNQISDQIHSFSLLESTGAKCDVDYLFKLSLPSSPINAEIQRLEQQLYGSKAVKRAAKLLAKSIHMPSEGLFGAVDASAMIDLNKAEHKQVLFFDVLGLDPAEDTKFNPEGEIKLRKNGKPLYKIDKAFQAKHKKNPTVAAFSNISKAYKLRNAYVKSLIKLWGSSLDFKADQRIRPTYNYDKVVTGRSSADKPKLLGLALETLH